MTQGRVMKRVFVSAPLSENLDPRRLEVKEAILRELRAAMLEPQEFSTLGIPFEKSLAWTIDNVRHVMRRCVGAVILGLPRWRFTESDTEFSMITEYSHCEGAIALALGIPTLLLKEQGVLNRGVVSTEGGKFIVSIPAGVDAGWIAGAEFRGRFQSWLQQVRARKDVFLGYCGKNESVGVAAWIHNFLRDKCGATVENWAMDFRSGVSILEEIDRARANCSGGIFLFSEDDPLEGSPGSAAPRDNVVFEAGYFISAKGPSRCVIIREGNAKMPADLGGAIYLKIEKGQGIASIETKLAEFLENL